MDREERKKMDARFKAWAARERGIVLRTVFIVCALDMLVLLAAWAVGHFVLCR